MNCPSCSGVPLEEKAPSQGLFLDLCAVCGGAWFDAGELEALGARVDGFKDAMEHAGKTHLPTTCLCPRCSQAMDRCWIAEAEFEFKICSGCKGTWLERERLLALRGYLKRKAVPNTPLPGPALPNRAQIIAVCAALRPAWLSRARILAVCAGLVAAGLLYRVLSRSNWSSAASAPEAVMTAADYERAALERRALAVTAEVEGRLEEAEDEYKSSAEYYYAAIVAAAPPENFRLELEYAKAGAPIARIVRRRGRLAESEDIRKISGDVFRRHRVTKEQILAWQRQDDSELQAAARRLR